MAQTIDNRLLAYPAVENKKEEREAAGELRRQKMAKEEANQEEGHLSLRQRIFAARAGKAKDKKGVGARVKEAVVTPVKMGTNHALRWAWLTLIPSWGLSLVYINMHIFLRQVFPSMFCKLGEEWQPKIVGRHGRKNIAGTAFGIAEVMALLFLDIIAFIIIGSALAFLVIIINFIIMSWWEKLGILWKAYWDLGWGAVQALRDLF